MTHAPSHPFNCLRIGQISIVIVSASTVELAKKARVDVGTENTKSTPSSGRPVPSPIVVRYHHGAAQTSRLSRPIFQSHGLGLGLGYKSLESKSGATYLNIIHM